jgi:hypothetical protein
MSYGGVKNDFSVVVNRFLNQIKDDPRIGPTHISLFMAIVHSASEQKFDEPISVFSKNLMRSAKISGIATYHKCMQDLQAIGFINYVPSYNPLLGSLIYLFKPDRE